MIIRVNHLRLAGMCIKGSKPWFVSNGFDWKDFLKNGIDSEELLKTNDPRAFKVVELASER